MVAHGPGPEEGRSCRKGAFYSEVRYAGGQEARMVRAGADFHPNLGTSVVASASSYSALATESGGGSALAAESGGGSAAP
jgi:hypothetical protein